MASPGPADKLADGCGEDDDACGQLPRERAEFNSDRFPTDERGVTLDRQDPSMAFYYGFPKALQADKTLAAFLNQDAEALYRQWIGVAQKDLAGALKSGHQRLVIERRWAITAQTGRIIGLVKGDGDVTVHEQLIETPMIWDRKLGRPIEFTALFDDPRTAMQRIQAAYCERLKRDVAQRGSAVDGAAEPFMCPPLSGLPAPLLVGGRTGRTEHLRVLVGHFRVYAEGAYEVEVPVTSCIRALVRPEYRDDFGGASGPSPSSGCPQIARAPAVRPASVAIL